MTTGNGGSAGGAARLNRSIRPPATPGPARWMPAGRSPIPNRQREVDREARPEMSRRPESIESSTGSAIATMRSACGTSLETEAVVPRVGSNVVERAIRADDGLGPLAGPARRIVTR
jgi:hypothetical protein